MSVCQYISIYQYISVYQYISAPLRLCIAHSTPPAAASPSLILPPSSFKVRRVRRVRRVKSGFNGIIIP
jgi:hypothetical protein